MGYETDYIKINVAAWQIKYGQIQITGRDYQLAKRLFEDYLAITFELETFRGTFPHRHFIHEDARKSLRLACAPFFGGLKENQAIYIKPLGGTRIGIFDQEPTQKVDEIDPSKVTPTIVAEAGPDVTKLLVDLVKENRLLREENEELMRYKDRLEKYQNLEYIYLKTKGLWRIGLRETSIK